MQSLLTFASKYSTLLVLGVLCLGFSLASIVEQPPSPTEAADLVASHLSPADLQRTLIAATDSPDDAAFSDALKRRLASPKSPSNSDSPQVVRGTPQDVRKAMTALLAARSPTDTTTASNDLQSNGLAPNRLVVVQSPDTQSWKLFENLHEKFPDADIVLMRAVPTLWPNFLKSNNLINIVDQIVVIAILAVGMTLVILTGGIDLSVGSLIALSSVLCARAIRDWGGGPDASITSMILAGALALAACGLCGLFNGSLIVGFGMPPFIATLGTMLMASGLAFILSQGQSIDAVPDNFIWLGRGLVLGLPVAVILMLSLYAIAHWVMQNTTYGRYIYAIGGNVVAAKLCGIRVHYWIVSTYVLSSLLAGLGGLVMASRLKSGDAKYGAMYELYVIAAVVVGGTSLRGGYGSVFGTLIGALIIAVIQNGMNLIHIESNTQKVAFGAIILLAVLFDRLKHSYVPSERPLA